MSVSTHSHRGTTAASLAPIALHIQPVHWLTVGQAALGQSQRELGAILYRYERAAKRSRTGRTARYERA
jgi:hypothetical protein